MLGDKEETMEKRSRKQTAFFEVKKAATKKAVVTEGAGIKLADNPHFCQELEKVKGDSEVCKALHLLLFGTVGKKTEIKKNLRSFSGFPSDVSKEEKKLKVLEKKNWTVSLTKEALEPRHTKPASAPGSGKKRKSVGKAGKKGAKRSKKSSDKPKRAPSAYILYCNEHRAAVKEEHPELSMIEQTKVLGSMWNALDEDAKKPWVEKAAQTKQAMQGGATVDDIDFGSDEDGSDGEGAGSLGDGEGDESEEEEEAGGSDDGAEDDDFKALDEEEEE